MEGTAFRPVMKKILLIILGILIAAGITAGIVFYLRSGYIKVLTAKVVRQDLTTVISGTGQIKPKTYVNLGATAMGRVTHLYVKEGDRVTKGQTVASIENVQQEATVSGQRATIASAHTDIASYVAAEKTAQANIEHAKADLVQKQLDYQRAQALYREGIVAKQDFDAKQAAYDTDVASVAQADAGLNQARAQTDSARGHLHTQEATLRGNLDQLSRTLAVAPFDGIVTNEPIREGETVVVGIQNAEGSTLMTLADMSVITAEVKVDETDIVNIRIGQHADVLVDALPGKIFSGHVTLVGDQAILRSTGIATSQSTTGTEEAKDFKVVVTIDNPSPDLRPGLSTTTKITTAHKSNVVTLPIQALTLHSPDDDLAAGKKQADAKAIPPQQGVFVIEKDKHGKSCARFVAVTTGITGSTDIEALSGVKVGDEIVSGPFKTLRVLKNNARIKRETDKPVVPATASIDVS